MTILTHYWDKILLGVVAVLVAILLAVNVTGTHDATDMRVQHAPAAVEAENLAAQFTATVVRAQQPAPEALPRNVFIPKGLQRSTASMLWMPEWGLIDPETGERVIYRADASGDGIPNEWKIRFGLDWTSPHDAHEDKDGDGLTNKQEFLLDTDPTDPHDPNFIEYEYRLAEIYRPSRELTLMVVTERAGGNTYQIRYKGRTQFMRDGGIIEDDGEPLYKIGEFTRVTTNVFVPAIGDTREEDRSELRMTNVRTGEEFTLVMRQESLYPYNMARLVRRESAADLRARIQSPDQSTVQDAAGTELRIREGDVVPIALIEEDATVVRLDAEEGVGVFRIGAFEYTADVEE